jgi:hypothetical protein
LQFSYIDNRSNRLTTEKGWRVPTSVGFCLSFAIQMLDNLKGEVGYIALNTIVSEFAADKSFSTEEGTVQVN